MKCPYPDCPARSADEDDPVDHACQKVAPHVYCCAHCNRLSLRCEKASCPALNRPYSRYCRFCNDDARDKVWFGTAAMQWEEAGRFSTPVPTGGRRQTDVDEVCRFIDYLDSPPLVELQFVDGLIAVHQAGVFACLVHPFRDREAVVWTTKENRLSRYPQAAFPPFRMPEGRHVVFSSPHRVMAVDVWSLGGWSHTADRIERELFRAEEGRPRQLIAAPVALSDRELGLLSRNSAGQFEWRVVAPDAKQPENAHPENAHPESAWTKLPLQGKTCRATRIADQAVIFATEQGHWLWRLDDALHLRVESLVTLYQADAAMPLIMDDHETRADHYSFPRHFLHFCPAQREGEAAHLSWYFLRAEGPNRVAENYRFFFDDTRAQDPIVLDRTMNATPLGVFTNDGSSRMLFLAGGRLFCDDHGDQLHKYDRFIRVPNESELTGLSYHEPLLIGIRRRREGEQLLVHALDQAEFKRQIDVSRLKSDPLAWGPWLWTTEIDADQLVLRRRNLHEECVHA